jgi:hypothetical protein
VVVDDGEVSLVELATHCRYASARNLGADGPAPEHSREHEVIGVDRRARRFPDTVLARDASSDGAFAGVRHWAKDDPPRALGSRWSSVDRST